MREITTEELNQLKKENKKILLDLYGVWCGPCKALMPRIESIEKEYQHVEFVKMDVDKNREFLIGMGITSVPTVMIYDGENLINRSSGVQPESHYKSFLTSL